MRIAGQLLADFREPTLHWFNRPGTFLVLVWGTGWSIFAYTGQMLFMDVTLPGIPEAARFSSRMVRFTELLTLAHIGMFLLLLVEGRLLLNRRARWTTTPWAAWLLAFGVLAGAQAGTTAVGLMWRLDSTSAQSGLEKLRSARAQLAQHDFSRAMAAYDEAFEIYPLWEWRREQCWVLVAHPDAKARDLIRARSRIYWYWNDRQLFELVRSVDDPDERAASMPREEDLDVSRWSMEFGFKTVEDLDLAAAMQASAGHFQMAIETLESALTLHRNKVSRANISALEGRLTLYRQGHPFIGTVTED